MDAVPIWYADIRSIVVYHFSVVAGLENDTGDGDAGNTVTAFLCMEHVWLCI